MPKIRRQSAPYMEHGSVDTLKRFNWDDLRVFLAVTRTNSFRAAAIDLGLSFNTVRRHIERLEHRAGVPYLVRHAQGVEITREGHALLNKVEKMESAAIEIGRLNSRSLPSVSGRLRINITEGLGTFWLVPRLVEFQRAHPNLIVEANCSFREPDLTRMEADIAIQLVKPKHADLKVVRLGRMHAMPFASADYIKLFGTPKSIREIENHKIVEQLAPQLDVSAVARLFPEQKREGFVSLVTNTSTAHLWAVMSGAGIGMVPTYLAAIGAQLTPIDVGLTVQHDIWMAYHPDTKRLKRAAVAMEWLKENFDGSKFSWFADEFIHPNDITPTNTKDTFAGRFTGLSTKQGLV
ncbi:MAG: LysR family transcriptional regulator [Hyphomicrobiaceae bacterium]